MGARSSPIRKRYTLERNSARERSFLATKHGSAKPPSKPGSVNREERPRLLDLSGLTGRRWAKTGRSSLGPASIFRFGSRKHRAPVRYITSSNDSVAYNPNAFFGVWRATGFARSWSWESTNEKRPGFDPGRLLSAHRKEVVEMRQLRLSVAITIDHRFVLALSFGVVALTATVLLLLRK